jgi:hypothetical protein
MRFMMMVKADKDYEAGLPPDPKLIEAVGKLAEDMKNKGVMIETGGLLPSSMGARIRAAAGKLSITDGPFAEVKELIGGYAVVEAKSKQEAVELAKNFMQVHVGILGASYEGECEIRQMFGPGASCGEPAGS